VDSFLGDAVRESEVRGASALLAKAEGSAWTLARVRTATYNFKNGGIAVVLPEPILNARLSNVSQLRGFFLLFVLGATAWAVDPNRPITQYAHTAWRVQDGIEVGTTVAQMPDGYLWFGTPNGLLRFDGVKFVPYDLPPITPAIRGCSRL
jgi:hypothetical protein